MAPHTVQGPQQPGSVDAFATWPLSPTATHTKPQSSRAILAEFPPHPSGLIHMCKSGLSALFPVASGARLPAVVMEFSDLSSYLSLPLALLTLSSSSLAPSAD